MKSVTAYINFDGNCRDAMSFYRECLDTELHLNAYPDANGQPSSDPTARIMHSQLAHDGTPILMASDTPPGGGSLKPGNNFSVSIHCDSLDQIERVFSALAQNGKARLGFGRMACYFESIVTAWLTDASRNSSLPTCSTGGSDWRCHD